MDYRCVSEFHLNETTHTPYLEVHLPVDGFDY